MKLKSLLLIAGLTLGLIGSAVSFGAQDSKVRVRAGHFPNVTHAQGVIGQARGDFEKALGDKADIDWKLFNS
ncbi:MAG: hypothetical protein ACREN0_08245, partial [Thermodesulfobacteriota bacterium]